MAEAARDWIGKLALVALMASTCARGAPQSFPAAALPERSPNPAPSQALGGSIAGRLTDLGSLPLAAATVIARNEATGVETRTTTSKNGSYRLTGLPAGVYTLEAESPKLGRGQLRGIYVAGGGYQAKVQAAMAFEPVPQAPFDTRQAVKQTAWEPPRPSQMPQQARDPGLVSTLASIPPPPADPPRNLDLQGLDTPLPVALAAGTATLSVLLGSQPLLSLGIPGHEAIAAAQAAPAGAAQTAKLADLETATVILAATSAVQAAFTSTQPSGAPGGPVPHPVDPVTPAVVTELPAAELQALPATGRRWQDFVLDSPTASPQAGERAGQSLRGSATEPPETTIDGVSTRLAFGANEGSGQDASGTESTSHGGSGQNGMAQVWAAGHASPLAEAAIRAVQTAAGNAEAQSARNAGGEIDVDTWQGDNNLHGQGFLFDKQNSWGARNPFTQWVKQTTPATLTTPPLFTPEPYTPPDRETVFGFGLGGRIRRDKVFWFGALDGYNRNDPGVATVKHPDQFFAQPSNDQMQVLSARLGLSGVNPVAEGLGAYSQMLTTLDDLLGPAPRTAAQVAWFGRGDWEATERHRFTLEEVGAHWNSPGGGLTRVSEVYGSNSFGSSKADEELLIARWEAFLTPNLLAVTQGSVGHTLQAAPAGKPSTYEHTLLPASAWGQLPQISIDARYGFTIGNPSRFGSGSYPDEHVLQASELVSWVRGNLLVKAGFDLSHNADATSLLRNQTGTYSYSNVENYASDALVFAAYGLAGEENLADQHNCDQTGRVWRDGSGTLHGLGYLPCYSYYSQLLGPTNWNLSTNDWAGFSTVQWQPHKLFVVSAGLRWEKEQLPPPIAALDNPALPLTQRLPSLGVDWGPRIGLAIGSKESHWPVLRLGYGMYYGRTQNSTLETALTQTGSLKGDLSYFMRPTDNLLGGGAPPFPYVLTGAPATVGKPGAVQFAPAFHNSEVHQAIVSAQEELPAHVQVAVSGFLSLGRRLPISIDTNFDPAVNPAPLTYAVVDGSGLGPIKTSEITVPFYASRPFSECPAGSQLNAGGQCGRLNPDYQQITQIEDRANSTYEAAQLRVSYYRRKSLSLHGHYVFAHAADWNPNESTTISGSDVLDPANFAEEYGVGDLDVRHSGAVFAIAESPWKFDGGARRFANNWTLAAIAQFRSGLPYTMRTSGRLAEEFDTQTGAAIVALGPSMNGSGGDNRVYGIGRNTYRYPATWKVDLRAGKKIDLGPMRQLELLLECFNLFNHQNVTQLETTGYYIEPGDLAGRLPTLNFLTGLKPDSTQFGKPLNVNATNFYRERQIQIGLRMRF